MLRTSIVALVLAVVLAPSVIAAEKIDRRICGAGTSTLLFNDKEQHVTVYTYDIHTIIPAEGNLPKGPFSQHCTGTVAITPKGVSSHGVCVEMDSDGDVEIATVVGHGGGNGTFEWVGGTGKWAGVKATGEYKNLENGKSSQPGIFYYCLRATGNYTLAMKK